MVLEIMNLWPLIIVLLPILLLYSNGIIYRSIYSRDVVKDALEKIAQYRMLKEEAKKNKRALKKLQRIMPEYQKARGIVTRSIIVKMILLMTGYILGSLAFFYIIPVLPAPYDIPLLTIHTEAGPVIPSFLLYFLTYLIVYLAMRDTFL